ncbi:hypothetical protein Jiend_42850 [Micromonospora endophytica]|nr:hypothetical protein Jiend_42850 [Micromonospora endophytica]
MALTLDHDHLDPFAPELARRVDAVGRRLAALGLAVVIETGARYLLDPWHKHAPTLLHDDPARRVEFLRRAVRIGADLGAEAVSFWAGVRPDDVPPAVAWERLVAGCATVVEEAENAGVTLGFEPEPGMLVEDIAGWRRLHAALGRPTTLGLTLDIGHCRCLEPQPVPDCVRDVGQHLVNVQIDDMRRDVHEHLEFGTGEIDFPPVLAALREVGYAGLVAVELPRHSHAAPAVAARSLAFLRAAAVGDTGNGGTTHGGTSNGGTRRVTTAMTPDALRAALADVPDPAWLTAALHAVAAQPAAISRYFPAAGRRCGRADLPDLPGWTADEAARALLLATLPAEHAEQAETLYRTGDAAEKRAVLKALPLLPVGAAGVPLLHDALRTNDTRLIAAALGPYAEHLDQATWRQAVLKCVFTGVALAVLADLDERADAELAGMLAALAAERHAAGRSLPTDATELLDRLTTIGPPAGLTATGQPHSREA